MRNISVKDAIRLAPPEYGPAVTIYLDGPLSGGRRCGSARKSIDSLCQNAERMIENSSDLESAKRIVQPLRRVLWLAASRSSSQGMALFHCAAFTRAVSLPVNVLDQVYVADSFHIKPLLRCLQLRPDCLLLVLGNSGASLLAVSLNECRELVRVPLTQKTMYQDYSEHADRCWFVGELAALRQDGIMQTMRSLNRVLHPYWGQYPRPLVLAGPQHLQIAFRSVSTNPNLVAKGVSGYVEDLDHSRLAAMAGELVERVGDLRDTQAIFQYGGAETRGNASADLLEIGRAAAKGRVADLLVACDANLWGAYDREDGAVNLVDSESRLMCDDVLDDIAEVVLSKGGKVRAIPRSAMPSQSVIAAVFATA